MPEKTANYARGAESRGDSFPDMFWDSLKPFPGRGRITLRLAVTCTLIVLVADTFRMPMQDLLPFFVLFVTKEEKVTTALSALLVLFAVTLAIAASILIYKATGNRAEFRIPSIALEIFIGMFLFLGYSQSQRSDGSWALYWPQLKVWFIFLLTRRKRSTSFSGSGLPSRSQLPSPG